MTALLIEARKELWPLKASFRISRGRLQDCTASASLAAETAEAKKSEQKTAKKTKRNSCERFVNFFSFC
jgi:hypothetical protein